MQDPATLWHATAAPAPRRPPAQGEITADLLVIGGGFAGLSTALHAAEADLKVVLLEANQIASGATGRNAGFVVPNFAKVDPEAVRAALGEAKGSQLVQMAATSADLVFDLIQRHAIACDAQRSGWIQPSHSATALARAKDRVRQWSAEGRPVEFLTAAAVQSLTGAQGWLGGWIDHSGGVLNPVAYARGLARAAEKAGVQLHENSRVTTLTSTPEGWQARTETATIQAARVVNVTNAYADNLIPGLAQSFFPLKVFQISTEPLPQSLRERLLPGGQCVSDSRRNLFTFRFDAANRLITGGMHILGIGADARVPKTIHRRLAQMLDLPDLPSLAYQWSGIAAVMPSFLPRLITPAQGLIAGIACNGRGIAMTTAMGRELALWALGTPPEALAIPVSPPAPIPLHALMRHAPNALLPISQLRDRIESPAGLGR
ncbi:MAG: FAD-dependent oxidoreductase [Cypionkella sp.]|uniref:NAD(P)/FAD-dependent oxidoreductase n=1 Tax=Cypionkella sp. TaxID=2811411 RepID=UPI002AB99B69|nr:FAD-dependent oxidoreductase [Cypionkella sp.]MDZ4310695.1 FAD-dependent oxidoreductase [Cypionkella sp.]